jgi:hypothetical protein
VIRRLALLAVLGSIPSAFAQPKEGGKTDAKTLMATGVKLLEDKNYVGALAVFTDAYKDFPSAKILLNIGTTLKLLDRKAEAANVYERYLASPDADGSRRTEVTDVISDLDKSLGRVTINLTPGDAEVQVDGAWLKGSRIIHLNPGGSILHTRRDGYVPADRNINLSAGQQLVVGIALSPAPKPIERPIGISHHDDDLVPVVVEGPRSRIGAIASAHVSITPRVGSAIMVGATADATEQLSIDAAVLLGPGLVSSANTMTYPTNLPPKIGVYAGASFAFLPAPWRPRVAFGMPIFFSDGARFALRGAPGVEYVASRHLSLILEVGVEGNLNGETDIHSLELVPAFAATGRL